jgi:hypothetical protein
VDRKGGVAAGLRHLRPVGHRGEHDPSWSEEQYAAGVYAGTRAVKVGVREQDVLVGYSGGEPPDQVRRYVPRQVEAREEGANGGVLITEIGHAAQARRPVRQRWRAVHSFRGRY